MTQILRTRKDGCWQLTTNTFGTYLSPADDPSADTVITKEQLEGFELRSDLTKIPADLWERWLKLCIEMVRKGTGNLEVSCRLLRNDAGEYRIVVPEQHVTGVSVRVDSFDSAVDIETGEAISQWPPAGWTPCGSSHSHNTMEAFFSGTDDKYELGDPGLHIVVGTIDVNDSTYTLKASVTANRRRFDVDADAVVDLSGSKAEITYHPNVMTAIHLKPAVTVKPATSWGRGFAPFNYDSEWSDFTAPAANSSSAVTPEYQAVMDAVSALQLACSQRNVQVAPLLNRLSFELEDIAAVSEPLDDPFYWSTY